MYALTGKHLCYFHFCIPKGSRSKFLPSKTPFGKNFKKSCLPLKMAEKHGGVHINSSITVI